jgi:hypothetical protein
LLNSTGGDINNGADCAGQLKFQFKKNTLSRAVSRLGPERIELLKIGS